MYTPYSTTLARRYHYTLRATCGSMARTHTTYRGAQRRKRAAK